MSSPTDFFFSLGEKATKGDPIRMLDFNYYMLWIILLAFLGIFIGNLRNFFIFDYQLQYLGWALFGLAIMWFQYNNLANTYKQRKALKEAVNNPNLNKVQDIKSMQDGFKD